MTMTNSVDLRSLVADVSAPTLVVSHREQKLSAINGYKVAVNGTLFPEITPSSTRQLIGGFIGGVVDSRDMNFAGYPHGRYAVSRDHYPDTLEPDAILNALNTDPAVFKPAVRFPKPDPYVNRFVGTYQVQLALVPDPGESWSDFVTRLTIEEGDADSGALGSPPDDGRDYLFGKQFSVADAYLFTVTKWAKPVGFDLTEFPNIAAFQQRVGARPAVQAAMKEEGLLK